MNRTLLLQWVLGAVVVWLYALDRFDTPGPTRPTTTFLRYWMARVGYVFSMLALFLVLGGAFTDIDLQAVWEFLRVDAVSDQVEQMPGPLFAALVLTSLLPHFPYLNKLDDAVKRWFQRIGNIPFEARELSGRIAATPLVLYPESIERLRPTLAELQVDERWLLAPESSLLHRWARTAVLYASIKPWAQAAGYARYVEEQKAGFAALGERFDAMSGLDEKTLRAIDSDPQFLTGQPLRRRLPRDVDELEQRLCDFVAGGVLQVELGPRQRHAALARLGFPGIGQSRPVLDVHEVFLVAGLIFFGMLLITLVARRFVSPVPLAPNLRVLVMVPMIYAIAIMLAIYPKAVWPFADIRRVGFRPVAGYCASGALAAAAAFVVSLLFRYVFEYPGNLFDALGSPGRFREVFTVTVERWPWLLMVFFATVAIAWAADDYADDPSKAPKWLRAAEAAGLALAFGLLQWMIVELLIAVGAAPTRLAGRIPTMAATSLLIGATIGWFVPHLYRQKAAPQPVPAPAPAVQPAV
ncbi:MAG: hypothetical protein ROZ64_00775 [Burkholderiaceae bacterium]|jgi:hypothetical protein|nr:hypothetical protein [Burkholderiaceae bacterium]